MKLSIEHIGLAARDPIALKDWYVRVLAAKIFFQTDQSPPAFFLELPGGLQIEIYKGDRASVETSVNSLAGWRHLALRVESLDSARDELVAQGVEFTDPIKLAGGGGRILFFKDAEGNLLHLLERPANSQFKCR
jgi:glyoxylase I family protein